MWYGSVEISVTKVHSPILLQLRGGGVGVSNLQEKAFRNIARALRKLLELDRLPVLRT